MRNQLTEGKIFPVLIRFAVPVFLALLLQALYGAADLIIVGRFADAASVSAVSNGAQIMTTLTNVMASLAMGTTVLLGRKTGEHDRAGAGEILGSSIVLFTVLGIGMSFLVGFGASAIASIMKVPQEAFRYAVQYLQICGGGMFVITWYNLIGSVFRASEIPGPRSSRWHLPVPAISSEICFWSQYSIWDLLVLALQRLLPRHFRS